MIEIREAGPAYATLHDADAAALALVREALSAPVPGAKYDWRYQTGRWDGQTSLLTGTCFLAGLAPRVARTLTEAGYPVRRVPWAAVAGEPLGLRWSRRLPALWPHQEAAVAAAVERGRGVIQMATGSGKTRTAARLTSVLDQQTLVIVPSRQLLHQTAAVFEEALQTAVGRLGDGHRQLRPVTVASYQSLARAGETLDPFLGDVRVVIVDEAHHLPSQSIMATLARCGRAGYRFGFTATPSVNPLYDLTLEGATGPVIYAYTAEQGVADGLLKPPTVLFYTVAGEERLAAADDDVTDWKTIYDKGIIENAARTRTIADAAVLLGREWGLTLVLTQRRPHLEAIVAAIRARGAEPAVIHGETPTKERQRILSNIRGWSDNILVSTTVFDEGADLPEISAVVMAGGGKASHKVIQRLGRGMRRGGQDSCMVIDFNDNAHGILRGHATQRKRTYRREGWTVTEP